MTDDLAQLLQTLHLGRIAAILDAELAHAEAEGLGYQDLASTLARNDPPLLARSGPLGRVSGEGAGRQ